MTTAYLFQVNSSFSYKIVSTIQLVFICNKKFPMHFGTFVETLDKKKLGHSVLCAVMIIRLKFNEQELNGNQKITRILCTILLRKYHMIILVFLLGGTSWIKRLGMSFVDANKTETFFFSVYFEKLYIFGESSCEEFTDVWLQEFASYVFRVVPTKVSYNTKGKE